MSDPSAPLLYLQIVMALVSTGCGAALIRKALSFHSRLWLGIIIFLVSTAVFSLMGVHVPLYFLSDSDRIQHHLTADVMMFGAAGLVVVAIVGFTVDHMTERPSWLILASAACLAIGLFPFWYRINQHELNQQYHINIVEQVEQKRTLESILER